MSEERFTWTDFYMKFADRLREYRDDRGGLIEKVKKAYDSIGMKLPKLDSDGIPTDIDPYTVFGLFNKGITDANRRKIIGALAEEFGVEAAQPDDFEGIPLLNNLNATFYAFTNDVRRGEDDIDNLWRMFEAQIELAAEDSEENRKAFVRAYDVTVSQFGLGWKLTMGLHWVRPFTSINMDSRNRWFLGNEAQGGQAIAQVFPKKNSPAPDGKTYLLICDTVDSQLGTEACPPDSFPALSHAAFVESERVNREEREKEKKLLQEAEEDALGDEGVEAVTEDAETVRYWLYAPGETAFMWDKFYNDGIMGFGFSELGDLSSYPSKEDMRLRLVELLGDRTTQKNNALGAWQFLNEVKPGDIVFAKQGRYKILGRGIVRGEYEYDATLGDYPNLRRVEWTHEGEWTTQTMFAMKTLTDITELPETLAEIEAFFPDSPEMIDPEKPTVEHPPYSKEDFLSEVYMSEEQYDALSGVLLAKKNVILQGAPGVGKTFAAKRLAYSVMGVKDPERVMMVQFHQSYSYEDFIEGYRPSAEGFELEKGAFHRFCKRAAEDGEREYFFVIDEINRGNLSKIFGELFMLIEADKRGSRNKLQLLYSKEQFHVPSNVYLIGMMNTADRSLALLDYALRRRFAFFDLRPGFETEGFRDYLASLGSPKMDALVASVVRLNEAITEDDALGEGFVIGHSYLCGFDKRSTAESKLHAIVEYELIPLLKEYWFDDPAKVRHWTGELRRAIG